jgi:hypothetical protein
VFPASRIDLQMSSRVVLGNKMSLNTTARESYGMSPTSTIFISSSLIRRVLFSLLLLVRGPIEFYRLIKGGLQYPPVD